MCRVTNCQWLKFKFWCRSGAGFESTITFPLPLRRPYRNLQNSDWEGADWNEEFLHISCRQIQHKRSLLQARNQEEPPWTTPELFQPESGRAWNKLPESVVAAESVNAFKNRLDKEWGNQSSRWTPCPTSTSTSTSNADPALYNIFWLYRWRHYASPQLLQLRSPRQCKSLGGVWALWTHREHIQLQEHIQLVVVICRNHAFDLIVRHQKNCIRLMLIYVIKLECSKVAGGSCRLNCR